MIGLEVTWRHRHRQRGQPLSESASAQRARAQPGKQNLYSSGNCGEEAQRNEGNAEQDARKPRHDDGERRELDVAPRQVFAALDEISSSRK